MDQSDFYNKKKEVKKGNEDKIFNDRHEINTTPSNSIFNQFREGNDQAYFSDYIAPNSPREFSEIIKTGHSKFNLQNNLSLADNQYFTDENRNFMNSILSEDNMSEFRNNNTYSMINDDSEEKEYVENISRERSGKKKIKLEYINKKAKRGVTFSKRKKGIMKKAFELSVLTGADILLVVANENGHVYTYATNKLKPVLTRQETLIKDCLGTSDVEE
ncbi:hypothetical protein NUSPORA_01548 [Nucleospora cyclopteri]